MRTAIVYAALLICGLIVLCSPIHGASRHPLDALDADEIVAATTLLRKAGHIKDETLVIALTLEEPDKGTVLGWSDGDPISRAAKAVLRGNGTTVTAIVDLVQGKVIFAEPASGGQPSIALPEVFGAIELVLGDEQFRAKLAKRGFDNPTAENVFCAPRTAGNFGGVHETTRRIIKVDCFDTSLVPSNVFATPIEGLFAIVDLDTWEIVDIVDLGVVPTPPGASSLDADDQGPLRTRKPVQMESAEGSNYTVDGSTVTWENWRFHLRWDVRAGLILSTVSYRDGNARRNVLYQGSLAEIYVPYMDPTAGWYYRNYLDEGDYGLGTMAVKLSRGSDCPEEATYLSPVMANAAGGADTLVDRVCLFERAKGEPTWRHTDLMTEDLQSRADVDLVVRYITTVGNYDYLFDWLLDSKGRLTFRGGASGLDAVKGVASQSLSDETAAADTEWGPLIAAGRAGINHDHFFSVRLDVDVDGTDNRFIRDRLVAVPAPKDSPRKSIWTVKPEVATKDSEAKFRLSYTHPSLWKVVHRDKTNALGYPVGYVLQPGANALPLADASDPPLTRAQFANYHLWVTPYDAAERFAAGDRPNQSEAGEGLPKWTSSGRGLDGEDLVLWYTMGFHHVPSAEDWPVYNVGWHSVTLRPYNFFDRNPAMDLPAK